MGKFCKQKEIGLKEGEFSIILLNDDERTLEGVNAPMKKLITAVMAVFLLLSVFTLAGAEEITYTGTVKGGKLNMRESNSSDSKSLGSFKSGTKVTVLENDGTWCKVQSGNKIGYMMTEYLIIEANYTHLDWVETKHDGTILTLREKADHDSAILLQVMSGVKAERIEKDGDWSRIRVGHVFGWVENSRVAPLSGEFETLLTSEDHQYAFDFAALAKAPKEVGSPRMRQRESGFPYIMNYPNTRIEAADEKIQAWLNDTLSVFEQDFEKNHAGESGSFQVDYRAVRIDDRYQSILLAGRYTAGKTAINVFLPINIDAQEQKILTVEDMFQASDRLLFCLDARLENILDHPTDGYQIEPDMSALSYGVMNSEGFDIYLPAGSCMPAIYGDILITLPYTQIAEIMNVESAIIKSKVRTIDPTKPMIALTFDDGPSEHTIRILKVLAQYDARATFCVQGVNVEPFAEIVKLAISQGNEIASHTWNHPDLEKSSESKIRKQLEDTNNIVAQVTGGYQVKVLRPPYGNVTKKVKSICAEMDMIIAHWELDTLDWATRSTNRTYNKIMSDVENGLIILCHDIYETTAEAAERVIPELVEQGYQLVTVSELMSFHKDGVQPGTVYSHLKPENIRVD